MVSDRVIIEELFLRLPGMTVEAARVLAREVAQRVGEGLGSALPARSLGSLDLRLTAPPDAEGEQLADAIAAAVLAAVIA